MAARRTVSYRPGSLLDNVHERRRRQTLSHLHSLLGPKEGPGVSWGPPRRGSDPSNEVHCLTLSREQLTVYLPPSLPHSLAVAAVEDILEAHHYRQKTSLNFSPHGRLAYKLEDTNHRLTSQTAHLPTIHRKTSREESLIHKSSSSRKNSLIDSKNDNQLNKVTSNREDILIHKSSSIHESSSIYPTEIPESVCDDRSLCGSEDSRFDSGIFSEPGQKSIQNTPPARQNEPSNFLNTTTSVQNTPSSSSFSSASVLDKLDSLEKRIQQATMSSKKVRVPVIIGAGDVSGKEDEQKEDLEKEIKQKSLEKEIRQIILSRLSIFRKQQPVDLGSMSG